MFEVLGEITEDIWGPNEGERLESSELRCHQQKSVFEVGFMLGFAENHLQWWRPGSLDVRARFVDVGKIQAIP